MSRSSLNAESQACSAAMDALEYLLTFWEGCVRHDFQLRQLDSFSSEMPSALVVDAKALYDSLKAETPSLQGDKRTKIEVTVTKQKMVGSDTDSLCHPVRHVHLAVPQRNWPHDHYIIELLDYQDYVDYDHLELYTSRHSDRPRD